MAFAAASLTCARVRCYAAATEMTTFAFTTNEPCYVRTFSLIVVGQIT